MKTRYDEKKVKDLWEDLQREDVTLEELRIWENTFSGTPLGYRIAATVAAEDALMKYVADVVYSFPEK